MEDNAILACLWEEIKLRQEHYWSSFNRFAVAIITINVVPYVQPDLVGTLGSIVLAFPIVSLAMATVCTWFLGAEYQRLRMVRNAYDDRIAKHCSVPRMPRKTLWDRLVAKRIGSATSILWGVGLAGLSVINLLILSMYAPQQLGNRPISGFERPVGSEFASHRGGNAGNDGD